MFNKIPENTFDEITLQAGMLLYNFNPAQPEEPDDADIICATTGGINATCVPTYSDQGEDIDNCPLNMKELKHLDGWECKMTFTSLGLTAEQIKLALGAADITALTHKIAPRRDIDVANDFNDIWWVGDKAGGGMVVICLKNALSTGGFALQTTKNGKGQLSFELTGHVSINAQNDMPMEFYSTDAPEIGTLTVASVAGTASGDTKITVTPAKEAGNAYYYKVATAETEVTYGQYVGGWDAWNGTADITAQTGKVITVVEADAETKAVKAGHATVTAKT